MKELKLKEFVVLIFFSFPSQPGHNVVAVSAQQLLHVAEDVHVEGGRDEIDGVDEGEVVDVLLLLLIVIVGAVVVAVLRRTKRLRLHRLSGLHQHQLI